MNRESDDQLVKELLPLGSAFRSIRTSDTVRKLDQSDH